MAKLAVMRGIALVKGPSSVAIVLGKLNESSEENLLTGQVFPQVVELTLRGGEQHSQILGLQAALGVVQRLTSAIGEANDSSMQFHLLLFM